jgi:hypothetical protein
MSALVPFEHSRSLSRSESRRTARSLDHLDAATRLEIARIEAAAELQAVRADAVTYVGKRAMHDAALLTRLEQQLVLMVPMASGRLQAIADITALALAEVVGDTLRQVR